MYVAPSLLSADFLHLEDEVKAVCAAGADLLHIDVMDGHFVPNLTFGPAITKAIQKTSSVPLDVHLMVENVPSFVELFLPLKPKFITFHAEAHHHPIRLLEHIKKAGVNAGLVLNPHTPVSTLKHLIEFVDIVLLMSVNPGFGGQEFLPLVYDKIKELRELIDKKMLRFSLKLMGV